MKTEYKYIKFVIGIAEYEQENGGTSKPIYECRNKKTDDILAYIEYYKPWKQYCFTQADSNIIFSEGCLADIIDFIKQLKQ